MIESVDAAVANVKASSTKLKDRTSKVAEYLKGNANPDTPEGRKLLDLRARFMTKLRVEEVWPS